MKTFLKSFFLSFFLATALTAAPQAVVFDFGGVMTGAPNRAAVAAFVRETFQLLEEEFEEVKQKRNQARQAGKTEAEFWKEFAQERGIVLPFDWEDQLKEVIIEAINPTPEMFALAEHLNCSSIRVGLLSNIDARLASLLRELGLYEPFDPCLLSCDLGVEKPDPKIYAILLATLGLPAEEIVFIDDRLENVQAAKAIGIDALLFESPQQVIEELLKRAAL